MAGRRTFLKLAAAAGLAPSVVSAQGAAKVVVVGGGFGGATCARWLKKLDPALEVTLVEPNSIFTACPFSNEVIAGQRDLLQQQFGYDGVVRAGVVFANSAATAVDPAAQDRDRLRRHETLLRPAGHGAGHRSRFQGAARLRRGRGREDAACLEGRRADRAAAPADRQHGRWRAGGDRRRPPRPIAARPAPTSAPA